jgi:hypothetical protein
MVKSLQDRIVFNKAHVHEEMPYFGHGLMEQAQQKGALTDKAYRDALATNHWLTGGLMPCVPNITSWDRLPQPLGSVTAGPGSASTAGAPRRCGFWVSVHYSPRGHQIWFTPRDLVLQRSLERTKVN